MNAPRLIVVPLLLLAACNAPGSDLAVARAATHSGGTDQSDRAEDRAAACDGLAGVALATHYQIPYYHTSDFLPLTFGPASDGTGTAAGCTWAGPGPYHPECHFIRSVNGELLDSYVFGGGDESQFWIDGEDHEFLLTAVGPTGGMGISAYADDGTRIGDANLRDANTSVSVWVVPISSGGAWVLRSQNPNQRMSLWIDRYDQALSHTGTAEVAAAADAMLAIGVSKSGDALVAWRAGTQSFAQWFGADVTPKSAPFEIRPGAGMTEAWAMPLADGDVALLAAYQDGSTKVFAVATDASARAEAAPVWLQARAGVRSALIHGGTAYAFWPATPACSGLEIVAANGTSCACLAVPELDELSNVGADGSLLVPYRNASEGTAWYPALLK